MNQVYTLESNRIDRSEVIRISDEYWNEHVSEFLKNKESFDKQMIEFLNTLLEFKKDYDDKIYDFYREDVEKYGFYQFSTNDKYGYVYLGEWDGYDYLYTLVISQWVNKELTLLFGDKWIPVFKRWFEDNSGLEVREIDLEGRFLHL